MRTKTHPYELSQLPRMSLLLAVIVPTTAFCVDAKSDLAITVLVFNFRQVPNETLAKAEDESQRILARAGVHVTWRDCPTGVEPCQKGRGRVFFLAIKGGPLQNKMMDTVSGYALLPEHVAIVHYDYLPHLPDRNRSDNETAVVLGCVITHELGHLLLGARMHSNAGIMRADWGAAQIQRALQSQLSFLPKETILIHVNPSPKEPEGASALVSGSH